jgi:5'-nucleotidase
MKGEVILGKMSIKPQILLTNDDGIESPGLWAAAKALSELGFVQIVAPRDQQSGAGRSMPVTSDGIIATQEMRVNSDLWTVYSVGGSPAQAVQHAILEILPQVPDLVVSGINYGQNIGIGVTVSGTVGAALEAAASGIPSLAASLETGDKFHLTHSTEIDFSIAAHFTAFFGRLLLEKPLLDDVAVLKIDVPSDATIETPWEITRLAQKRFFKPSAPIRESWAQPGSLTYRGRTNFDQFPPGTDTHTLAVKRLVSVTPLSLDLTSRVNFARLSEQLRD